MYKALIATACILSALPVIAGAQQPTSQNFGPQPGDREFSVAGSGSSDKKFDSTSLSVVADIGWYHNHHFIYGLRQSINYANIEGESFKDDFWNGSTRGYLNLQHGNGRARPFIGTSLGGIYGDGVKNSAFAGAEAGLKYYLLSSTYLLTRMEYQWFFSRSDDATDAFRDGAWAGTVGIGLNF